MFENIINFVPTIFYQVLYMSVIGSIIGLIFYFIRSILDRKISGKLKCFIWMIVLLAFLIPARFEITLKSDNENKFINQVREIKDTSEEVVMSKIESIKEISNIESSAIKNNNGSVMNIEKIENAELNTDKNKIDIKDVITNVIIPYLWISGFIVFILIFIHGSQKLRKRISKNIYKNERIENILYECKMQLNIKNKIKIILQDYKKIPSIFGILTPAILITEETLLEDDQTIKYIFLHELSHYKRKDIILNYILIIVLSIHWFNPAVWFLFNKIRQDIEIGADELATKKLSKNERKEYGMILVNLLKNSVKENYTASLLCMSDKGKNMERRILMIKGKTKTTIIGIIIIMIVLGIVAGLVFVKFKDQTAFSTMEKIGDNPASQGIVEELSKEESTEIENYINEICNNYFSLGRLPQFNNINKADRNWIYGHLTFKDDSYLTKQEIENELKNLFGNNLNINLENDKEKLESNNIYYNIERGEYELLPYGSDMNIYYVINSIKKANQEYIVNVIEYVQTDNAVIGKYSDTRYQLHSYLFL